MAAFINQVIIGNMSGDEMLQLYGLELPKLSPADQRSAIVQPASDLLSLNPNTCSHFVANMAANVQPILKNGNCSRPRHAV